jgi:hypothetical protein
MEMAFYNDIYNIIHVNICNVIENLIPLTEFLDLNLNLEYKEEEEKEEEKLISEPPEEVKALLDKSSETPNDLNIFLTKDKTIPINNLK